MAKKSASVRFAMEVNQSDVVCLLSLLTVLEA